MLVLVSLPLLASCDEKSKNPVSEYGDAMIDAYKKGQAVKETADLDAIRKTIQVYYAENGKYPASLDEIANLIGKPLDTAKYDYNPQTGKVSLKK
ncbi:MAG: hypothetical protein C4550_02355 [Nitrospiraceae bacterium]|nr:MAG: hypothetical protein C4550_02355 [Nitrospiraceae bacterium]